MASTLLIDARHSEETRVVVTTNSTLDEFDYESSDKIQIKGNVYLAKVTRVEPSLQAAFVEYGGNRQGFLAFSEIHPDYYQIPVEDREAIIAEEEALARSEASAEEEAAAKDNKKAQKGKKGAKKEDDDLDNQEATNGKAAKDTGGDDILDDALLNKRRIRALKRRYKIQEVIKKRQILLIQVVKEERGNKGAALTSYLSLPGRYCVLMPNTTHGNGISRKIADVKERQRLRKILGSFTVPTGMGCIIRTVGMGRTKAEIKRDFDYLSKTWAGIREATLKSVAPALIFEEGNLIKRSLRDIYDKHIKEVLVEGAEGYKVAKDFMKNLMPTHAKNIKEYKGKEPLFQKFGVEDKIDSLFSPTITLKSGGYIVINPTEALVAIDVNSGKATKEHNIEETALQTNLEAASEIARQLRLRDIAGLIVIDFIDMEEFGNVKTVERRFREALKADRARIFTSRISALGLLEMSRQRLRASLYEISTQPCPHCEASGRISSLPTLALRALRQVEGLAMTGATPHVLVQAPQELALLLLNSKRQLVDAIEKRFNVTVTINPNTNLKMPHFDVRGVSDTQLQKEVDSNFLVAAGLMEDSSSSAPAGFGKSDGRGAFPGRKRRRGKRGGQRQRFGRDDRSRGKPEDKKAEDRAAEAKPSGGEAKPDANKTKAEGDKQTEARAPRRGRRSPYGIKKPYHGKPAKPAKSQEKSAEKKTSPKAATKVKDTKPAPGAADTVKKPTAAKTKTPAKKAASGQGVKAKKAPEKKPAAKKPAKAAKTETPKKAAAKPAAPARKGWWSKAKSIGGI